jgi:hypothetical protein
MRRNALSLLLFLVAFAAVVGCTDSRFKHAAKHKEECILPPDDPRMNNPPTAEYRARVKNGEDKTTLINSSKQMGSGAGMGPNGRGGF